ncbi:hypothetical protein IEQ34_022952 [Dendrobium chrysotoxum]|uniref:C3H1-type domain-containing protein n=1 Tax=Dendrobium chrysotoxum TaxID=161865 RepID=A0AAV7G0G2_DENCH|nr:hypothetical protein IEQ34_022952 [Dendrobium chrysotoxum]
MGLYEEPDSNLENQLGFESPSFFAAPEKDISHGIDALKLEGNSRMGILAAGDADVDLGEGVKYPIRPSEPDCAFYLRTGCCKFGSCCRFNHPREKREVQGRNRILTKEFKIIKERDKGFPKVFNQCKFYSMPGGCRFGETCRYSHSDEIAESVPVELNSLGLPVRKGERVCSYYMRTGICKYHSSCKFHHPELSDIARLHVFGCHSASSLQNTIWPSPMPVESPTLLTASNNSSLNLDISQPFMPATSSEWLNVYKDQVRSQDSSLPSLSEKTNSHPSAVGQNGFSKLEDSPMQQKEVVDNRKESGKLQSQNGIRYEGFRLAFPWWQSHSKDHLPEFEGCLLSPIGLPQRPDHPVCTYYSRFGICKYGPACKFDHPMDENTDQSVTMSAEDKMEALQTA